MGFFSNLFGKKEEEKPAEDQTIENPVATDEKEESAEISQEDGE